MTDTYTEVCAQCNNNTFTIRSEITADYTNRVTLICTKCNHIHTVTATGGWDGYADIELDTVPIENKEK